MENYVAATKSKEHEMLIYLFFFESISLLGDIFRNSEVWIQAGTLLLYMENMSAIAIP